jgi:hypothetical protein
VKNAEINIFFKKKSQQLGSATKPVTRSIEAIAKGGTSGRLHGPRTNSNSNKFHREKKTSVLAEVSVLLDTFLFYSYCKKSSKLLKSSKL